MENQVQQNSNSEAQVAPQSIDFDFFKQEETQDTPTSVEPEIESPSIDTEKLAELDGFTKTTFGFGLQDLSSMYAFYAEQQREKTTLCFEAGMG